MLFFECIILSSHALYYITYLCDTKNIMNIMHLIAIAVAISIITLIGVMTSSTQGELYSVRFTNDYN